MSGGSGPDRGTLIAGLATIALAALLLLDQSDAVAVEAGWLAAATCAAVGAALVATGLSGRR